MRSARHGDVVVPTRLGPARLGGGGGIEIDIVGHEEVDQPVAVVVEKAAGRPPASAVAGDPSLFGNIFERAVPLVAIQDVLAPVGHEQVVVSVVVIVSDATALPPSRMRQACILGHVGERTVPIVVKQVACRLPPLREALKGGSIHQEDVEPPVMVVIEECDAAPHFLDEIVLFGRTSKYVDGRP